MCVSKDSVMCNKDNDSDTKQWKINEKNKHDI